MDNSFKKNVKINLVIKYIIVLVFFMPCISIGSVIKFTASDQLINPTTIDFENIDLGGSRQSSLDTRRFDHPSLRFENDPQAGGSIFIAENKRLANSVLTPLFSGVRDNAPLGVFGQRFYFLDPVLSFGFDFQDGRGLSGLIQNQSPNVVFNDSYELITRAFNVSGDLIGEKTFNFPNEPNGSGRYLTDIDFIGISSISEQINYGEVIYNVGSSAGYAIDNLTFSSKQARVSVSSPAPFSLLIIGLLGLSISSLRKKYTKYLRKIYLFE